MKAINKVKNTKLIVLPLKKVEDYIVMLSSVVIVTFNSLNYLKKCLKAVDRRTTSDYELILVDNNSEERVLQWLKRYRPENPRCKKTIKLFNSKNKGWPCGVNQGIKAAHGEYVALVNSDVVVTSSWLEHLIAHFQNAPQAGIVAPIGYGLWLDQDYQKCYGKPEYLRNDSVSLEQFASNLYRTYQGDYTETKFIIDSCIVAPRRLFNEIGLYDKKLFLNGSDLDISFRAGLAGYRLYVAEDVYIHHFRKGGRSQFTTKQQQKIYDTDYTYFFKKWEELLKGEPRNWFLVFNKNNPPWYQGLRKGRRENSFI